MAKFVVRVPILAVLVATLPSVVSILVVRVPTLAKLVAMLALAVARSVCNVSTSPSSVVTLVVSKARSEALVLMPLVLVAIFVLAVPRPVVRVVSSVAMSRFSRVVSRLSLLVAVLSTVVSLLSRFWPWSASMSSSSPWTRVAYYVMMGFYVASSIAWAW